MKIYEKVACTFHSLHWWQIEALRSCGAVLMLRHPASHLKDISGPCLFFVSLSLHLFGIQGARCQAHGASEGQPPESMKLKKALSIGGGKIRGWFLANDVSKSAIIGTMPEKLALKCSPATVAQ